MDATALGSADGGDVGKILKYYQTKEINMRGRHRGKLFKNIHCSRGGLHGHEARRLAFARPELEFDRLEHGGTQINFIR